MGTETPVSSVATDFEELMPRSRSFATFAFATPWGGLPTDADLEFHYSLFQHGRALENPAKFTPAGSA